MQSLKDSVISAVDQLSSQGPLSGTVGQLFSSVADKLNSQSDSDSDKQDRQEVSTRTNRCHLHALL